MQQCVSGDKNRSLPHPLPLHLLLPSSLSIPNNPFSVRQCPHAPILHAFTLPSSGSFPASVAQSVSNTSSALPLHENACLQQRVSVSAALGGRAVGQGLNKLSSLPHFPICCSWLLQLRLFNQHHLDSVHTTFSSFLSAMEKRQKEIVLVQEIP